MRVAVMEPWMRTCGVTTWAVNVAAGFRDLGVECDLVSFTKSGRATATRGKRAEVRPGWRWYPDTPDVVKPWTQAARVLDGYDLVVLNEPKNGPCDGQAKKNGGLPTYVEALHQTKTPWVTALHDATAYTRAAAPFLEQCVSAPSFTGIVIECRPGSYQCGEWGLAGHVRKIQRWPWLPYRPKGRAPGVDRIRAIGLGGRITSTKGFTSLAFVADRLPKEYEVHLIGAEAGGMGAAVSFTYYEALAGNHGWTGVRGDPSFISPNRSEWSLQIGNYGAANTGHTWWLQKDDHTMRYTGGYLDAVEAYTRFAISAQLTTRNIATTVEYSTLEAMDAGCAIIMPEYYLSNMGGAEYAATMLRHYVPARMSKKTIFWDDTAAADELVDAVSATVDKVETGQHDPRENWAAIERYHAPRLVATKILETVGR